MADRCWCGVALVQIANAAVIASIIWPLPGDWPPVTKPNAEIALAVALTGYLAAGAGWLSLRHGGADRNEARRYLLFNVALYGVKWFIGWATPVY